MCVCARVCVCLSVCVCLCLCMRSSVLTPTLPPSPIIYLVKGLLPKQDPLFKLQRPIGPRLKPSFFSVQLWPQGAKPSPCLAWEAGRWITRMGRPKGGGGSCASARCCKDANAAASWSIGRQKRREGEEGKGGGGGTWAAALNPRQSVSLSAQKDQERRRRSRMLCGAP